MCFLFAVLDARFIHLLVGSSRCWLLSLTCRVAASFVMYAWALLGAKLVRSNYDTPPILSTIEPSPLLTIFATRDNTILPSIYLSISLPFP